MRKMRMNKKVQKIFYFVPVLLCSLPACATDEIKSTPWVKSKVESTQAKKICSSLNLKCGNHVDVWKKKSIYR